MSMCLTQLSCCTAREKVSLQHGGRLSRTPLPCERPGRNFSECQSRMPLVSRSDPCTIHFPMKLRTVPLADIGSPLRPTGHVFVSEREQATHRKLETASSHAPRRGANPIMVAFAACDSSSRRRRFGVFQTLALLWAFARLLSALSDCAERLGLSSIEAHLPVVAAFELSLEANSEKCFVEAFEPDVEVQVEAWVVHGKGDFQVDLSVRSELSSAHEAAVFEAHDMDHVKHTIASGLGGDFRVCFRATCSPIGDASRGGGRGMHLHLSKAPNTERIVSWRTQAAIPTGEDRHGELAKDAQFTQLRTVVDTLHERFVVIVKELDAIRDAEMQTADSARSNALLVMGLGTLSCTLIVATGLYTASFLLTRLKQRKVL